jgi:predicted P-loop ATPase
MTFGASPEEWAHFDLVLGLTEDLLPCVADPGVAISDKSNMKAIGKTPSIINRNGKAAGIPEWTAKRSTGKEIERWSQDDRLGICLQCRQMRALDIDVDHPSAGDISSLFGLMIEPEWLPIRYRSNSNKCLLAFTLDGDFPKRSFKTEHGLVEFLGNGQQFVAIGTHTSGQRYEWVDGLPAEFPALTVDEFEKAWAAIVERFAVEPPYEAGTRRRGEDFHSVDPTAEYLVGHGLVLAEGRDGQLFVACPWVDGHSSDSGVTEACWFPAGSSGYEQGHYHCLHASCASRSDEEFREAIGCGVSADFDEIAHDETEHALVPLPPAGLTTVGGKDGAPFEATMHNVMTALETPGWFGAEIAFDDFKGNVVISPVGKREWRALQDSDYSRMRRRLDRMRFKPVGPELIRSATRAVGEGNRFDSAKLWLGALEWDGVARIDRFLADYLGVAGSDYATAVSRYWWTAHAGRVLKPGCKADMVPILVGPQGRGKTEAVKAMLPSIDNFIEVNLEHKDADLSRKMRGALLGELAELRGLQGRSAESNKAWVTSAFEEWTPKWMENPVRLYRRLLFVGTTNGDDFLDDASGERRWLPFHVGCAGDIGVERIAEDRDQLWAEAAVAFEGEGVAWRAAYELAQAEHIQFKVDDTWVTAAVRWLDRGNIGADGAREDVTFCTLEEAFLEALGKAAGNYSAADEKRMSKVLRVCGFERNVRRVGGHLTRGWKRIVT